jgi:hypothetical protein
MYQVFCNSKAHRKYQPYSKEYETIKEAELCKKRAEERQSCDVFDNMVNYKIKEV